MRTMKPFRFQHVVWLAILITHSSALSLLEALQSYPELSTVYSNINSSASLTSLFSNANNFTFLAPSNDAFTTSSPDTTDDSVTAILQYSLLQGGYPSLSFSNTSQFAASNLNDTKYTNVTGGQRVELILGDDGEPQAVTGNKAVSSSNSTEIVCVGGIIHIVNSLLTIPLTAVLEITAAKLEYFISILNIGGFLTTSKSEYVDAVLGMRDATFFIPNSKEALANATALSKTASSQDLQAMFEYHIVPDFIAYSSLLKDGLSLKTTQGTNITITIQDGDMYVNAAKVLEMDYLVANGVVHVIDSLLNHTDTAGPPKSAVATPTTTPTPSSTPTPTPNSSSSASQTPAASSSHKSHGSTVGIAVGVTLGVLALALLGFGIWFFLRSRKRKQNGTTQPLTTQTMGFPYQGQTGSYYVSAGKVQRQAVPGLGLRTTGLRDERSSPIDYRESKSSGAEEFMDEGGRGTPVIPQRSPSRVQGGGMF